MFNLKSFLNMNSLFIYFVSFFSVSLSRNFNSGNFLRPIHKRSNEKLSKYVTVSWNDMHTETEPTPLHEDKEFMISDWLDEIATFKMDPKYHVEYLSDPPEARSSLTTSKLITLRRPKAHLLDHCNEDPRGMCTQPSKCPHEARLTDSTAKCVGFVYNQYFVCCLISHILDLDPEKNHVKKRSNHKTLKNSTKSASSESEPGKKTAKANKIRQGNVDIDSWEKWRNTYSPANTPKTFKDEKDLEDYWLAWEKKKMEEIKKILEEERKKAILESKLSINKYNVSLESWEAWKKEQKKQDKKKKKEDSKKKKKDKNYDASFEKFMKKQWKKIKKEIDKIKKMYYLLDKSISMKSWEEWKKQRNKSNKNEENAGKEVSMNSWEKWKANITKNKDHKSKPVIDLYSDWSFWRYPADVRNDNRDGKTYKRHKKKKKHHKSKNAGRKSFRLPLSNYYKKGNQFAQNAKQPNKSKYQNNDIEYGLLYY